MKTYLFALCTVLLWTTSCKPTQDIKKSTFFISGSPPVIVEIIQDVEKPMSLDPIIYSDFLSIAFVNAFTDKGLKVIPQQVGVSEGAAVLGDIKLNILMARVEELSTDLTPMVAGELPESHGYRVILDYSFVGMGQEGMGDTKTYHTTHVMTKEEQREFLAKVPEADLVKVLLQKAADEVAAGIEPDVVAYLKKNK